ncbi:MAG: phenylalanine--tRNA ligase subunit beta [Candidatus Eremiobacteraeota bacterium]|nr:phenylalanine--tRNA ligase subunit beta [Candidatus Eremiobacteraeota bacterium]
MRVPISWLREYAAIPADDAAITERLAMLGFPVAEAESRPTLSGVVTGRIVGLEKHPNADRLQVGRVDVGAGEPLTIATAATNVAEGQVIAVATVGAQLPALRIERRTMRGVVSHGMMISAEELALPAEWFEDGILQLDQTTPLGADVVELFGLASDVLDVEITANRPDATSVVGLARELAASYGVPLHLPRLRDSYDEPEPTGEAPRVALQSTDCHRFVAQRFDGLHVRPSPAWMRIRLALAGQRPINNAVDVSNYVMLETGQPLHFYDASRIRGGTLTVRSAHEGEKIVTLDGAARSLSPLSLVIADDREPLCLAGLMGSASSEVTHSTSAIVVEAANFSGARIRRMSGALGLRTEASARHEKSPAPALTNFGAARAAQLLTEIGAIAYPPRAFGAEIATSPPVRLPLRDVERLLGLTIERERIARHLAALGCTVEPAGGDALAVTAPAWRRDLGIAADLIEEIARIEGYDTIEAVEPSVPPHHISSAAFDRERALAHALEGLGYREIVTHSLCGSAESDVAVEVRNPLSEEHRFLRASLVPGILDYFAANGEVRVFEIGEVFRRENEDVGERTALGFGFLSHRDAARPWKDDAFLRLRGDCETLLRRVTGRAMDASPGDGRHFHPGKRARLTIDGRDVGELGCIDPRTSRALGLTENAYVCLIDVGALPPYATPLYRPPSRFPSTYRDVALVVRADVSARDVERAVAAAAGPSCTGVRAFDEYRGPQVGAGQKSLAVRVTLQRFDTTITDEEADAAVAAILAALGERFGATIRT